MSRRSRKGAEVRGTAVVSRWNEFWFSRIPAHTYSLLRLFFGIVVLMHVTGLWGIYRLSDLRMRFPRHPVFAVGELHDGYAMPYPGLEWLPVPSPSLYTVFEVALLLLAVLMIVGLATRVVVPTLAVLYGYLFLTTQWNFHHHSFLMAIVLVVLACTRCGAHFSVDALLRGPGGRGSVSILPLRILQVLIVQLYVLTFLSKVGSGWLSGDIIVMLAGEGRIRGALAPFVLGTIGPQSMGVFTVAAEAFIAIGLVFPALRKAAIFVGVVLHLGLDALMDVGTFSYQMMALYIAFIHPVAGASVAIYDPSCASCRAWPRWAAALDWFRRLTWIEREHPSVRAALPEQVLAEGRCDLLVVSPSGAVRAGPDAWRYVLSRSPLTFMLAMLLYVPPLRWGADALWSVLGRRREARTGEPVTVQDALPGPAPWETSLRRAARDEHGAVRDTDADAGDDTRPRRRPVARSSVPAGPGASTMALGSERQVAGGEMAGQRAGQGGRRRFRSLVVVALVASGVVVAVALGSSGTAPDEVSEALSSTPGTELGPDSLELLGLHVERVVREDATTDPVLPPRLEAQHGPTYAAVRSGGLRLGEAWAGGPSTWGSITDAVASARDAAEPAQRGSIDSVELCLSHSYVDVRPDSEEARRMTNVHRGVLGLEASFGDTTERFGPTQMLAQNRSFERALGLFMGEVGAREEHLLSGDIALRSFGCDQVLVLLEDPPRAVTMERGATLVPIEAVTREGVEELADSLTSWMVSALHPDGRMTYKYWPSRGEESEANNMIRQWMATVALLDAAEQRHAGDPELVASIEGNIRHNLAEFYETEDDLGLIVYDEKVKLGAVALAATALLEFPDAEAFRPEREMLDRTLIHLWNEDGSFRTFHRPADRNDQQNFYPGEALFYWARLYEREPDPELLARFMASFEYYREWHLDEDNRNPAFVPWHTQAYYRMWRQTRAPELRDFIFEMNDWLLDMQEWDGARYPDVQGRFYDADRSHFGPPHSSSTGVYLEGLADAYRLAVDVGDDERAAAYRTVIRRGLRSIMQLQFTDEVDMYYISRRERVLGGVRTTVYDNEIRVDNVQHPLMGILNILDAFEPEDFLAAPEARD